MNRMIKSPTEEIPLVDPRLAAAATLLGGRLARTTQDPGTGRVTFHFQGLAPDFLEQTFNGELMVNLRDYISALDHVNALIAQYRARRAR